MTSAHSSTVSPHAGPVLATIGVLGFLAVSALAGGTALVLGAAPPDDWLDRIPVVDSWVVPGLVLGIGFGAGSLATAYGMLRLPTGSALRPVQRLTRHHWPWAATLLIGLGQVVWIGLELAYLPQLSPLQAVYGGVGVALVVLALHPTVRRYLTPARHAAGDRPHHGTA